MTLFSIYLFFFEFVQKKYDILLKNVTEKTRNLILYGLKKKTQRMNCDWFFIFFNQEWIMLRIDHAMVCIKYFIGRRFYIELHFFTKTNCQFTYCNSILFGTVAITLKSLFLIPESIEFLNEYNEKSITYIFINLMCVFIVFCKLDFPFYL